jgi:protein phosphatase
MTHVDAETTCKTLIEEANNNGGQDNITAVVIKPFHEEVKVC